MNNKNFYKTLLKKYHFRPSKRLGQNFLIDKKVLKKIIETADLSPEDTVLEIGPGLGVLTKELAKRAKKVIAVEKDKRMAEALKEVLKDYKNVEIIESDILKLAWSSSIGAVLKFRTAPMELLQAQFKLIANLPYYIASPVIRLFLETENPPKQMVLMIQKEVAQRICAKPPKMSLLSVSVQFYAEPKIISYVSRKSFWPQPKVDSAIIKIAPIRFLEQKFLETAPIKLKTAPKISAPKSAILREKFFKIAKAGFSSPRKQLANNLSKKLKIDKDKIKKALLDCGLEPEIRAESLSVKDWMKLNEKLSSL
ncbi:MAG: ribosomal RNA small subunit methyltransferase A [Candidatus Portnoybacteria bacterium RIFCSPLOWO2_12_FULL_39_9]|uniref:Ribosomal RNA small subunit methyltransferase A n=1 Tax=Candidatus Portnoybacteria bacterium RIFCSPHIGHO2_12_FULL_38_9 TaxID=1801997 RepID=A0A1G2FIP1_9BACT|nr:MAG: ribosomal RNA small subunit methyltransferase A [Candidatus Portnoybacteria bacterium RBG_13_40_8]OGZ36554.1 MAG: ribosomal RNA small subunit methyltransferase A [Candidatus Portnoybacteria bacterium RIFCSPHIGHO2_02_FULL_39_12]OGZ37448.1 MAG: ribosomal RNA small subunit methyltransferase A [Candidatus Portnoybacteria bacterium RIFCSPHIGHO2_12_FULL_38_9]OGZ39094.1 MAG: ribosomal RNA small subunit methyltransferase A [Candidatus Portnoybacteria bacterium RIFCSPLOWO2_01_FULL_38_39]OGZ40184